MGKVKIAAIIKNPFRDWDYRVDILEVDEEWNYQEIYDRLMHEMLGPFEVISITEKINFDRKFVLNRAKISAKK